MDLNICFLKKCRLFHLQVKQGVLNYSNVNWVQIFSEVHFESIMKISESYSSF